MLHMQVSLRFEISNEIGCFQIGSDVWEEIGNFVWEKGRSSVMVRVVDVAQDIEMVHRFKKNKG